MYEDLAEELASLRPLMFVYACALTDSTADAEDLVQDVLERALRFRAKFDGRNLRGWLATIMRNRASDLRRRAKMRQADDIDQVHVAVGDVEREAIARMQLEAVLAGADPVLALSAGYGTAHAVGLALGRSDSVISRRLKRARAKARLKVDNT